MARARLLRSVLVCSLVVLSMFGAALPAAAGQFTQLVVFGDSLSDTGRMFVRSGGLLPLSPPNYAGRFSNGPVWAEYLAEALDLPLDNRAWGGAQTDDRNLAEDVLGDLPGLRDELDLVFPHPAVAADPDAIYVVWAGANDFRAALRQGLVPDIAAMVENLLYAVELLYSRGARHVVVPNLPDLGRTPEGRASGLGPEITLLSAAFNQALESALTRRAPGVVAIDVFGLMDHVLRDPAEFGFTDVTTPCLTLVSVCEAPETHVFWDHVHPTTHGHAVLADKFAKAIYQAIVRRHRQR